VFVVLPVSVVKEVVIVSAVSGASGTAGRHPEKDTIDMIVRMWAENFIG
jgi:hypothetical protein